MEPVGLMSKPPDFTGTLSGLMGLKQRQQQLQAGAAEVQMKQQDARQRAAMANIDLDKHVLEDGTYDLNAIAKDPDIQRATGDKHLEFIQNAAAAKSAQLSAKSALLGLNNEQLKAWGEFVGPLASDEDVKQDNEAGRQKTKAAVGQFAQLYGMEAAKAITPIAAPIVYDKVPKGQLQTFLKHAQMQAQSVSEQQAQQNPRPGLLSTGTKDILTTVDPSTGIQTPTGQIVNKDLAGVGASSGSGKNDEDRYDQISTASTKSQNGAALANEVMQLASQVRTGKLTKTFADRLAVLKQHDPSVTDRQMLSKSAAQLKTIAIESASTDSQRSQIAAGFPDPDVMTPDALRDAALYVKGVFRMNQARQEVADKYKEGKGTSVGLRAIDNQFMQHADPFVFAYKELPAGAERQEFLQKHFNGDGDKIRAFLAQKAVIEHYGAK